MFFFTIVIIWIRVDGTLAVSWTLDRCYHGVGDSLAAINISRVAPIAFDIVSYFERLRRTTTTKK